MKNFKKALALILSVLMLTSAMMFTASAADGGFLGGYATSGRNGYSQFGNFSENDPFVTEVLYDAAAGFPYAHVTLISSFDGSGGFCFNNYAKDIPMAVEEIKDGDEVVSRTGKVYAAMYMRTNVRVTPGITFAQLTMYGATARSGNAIHAFAENAAVGSGEWEKVIVYGERADAVKFFQPRIRPFGAPYTRTGSEYVDLAGVAFFDTLEHAEAYDMAASLAVNKVTATFKVGDDTVATIDSCAGELIRVDDIAVEVPEGKLFGGWGTSFVSGKSGVEGTQFISAPSTDTTYTAIINEGTPITFVNGGNSTVVTSDTTVTGADYGLFKFPAVPAAPSGKVFAGWKNAAGNYASCNNIAGGLVPDTFTAQFIDASTVSIPSGAIYVDAENGNDNNAGTQDKPLHTIAKAFNKVADGGTIVLLKDTPVPGNALGAAGKSITITGVNNGIILVITGASRINGSVMLRDLQLGMGVSTEATFQLYGGDIGFDGSINIIPVIIKSASNAYANAGSVYVRTCQHNYGTPATNKASFVMEGGADVTPLKYLTGAVIYDSTVTVNAGTLNFPRTGINTNANTNHGFVYGKVEYIVDKNGTITGGLAAHHDYQPSSIFMGEQYLTVNGGTIGTGTYDFGKGWGETGVKKITINGGTINGTLYTTSPVQAAKNSVPASNVNNYQAVSIIEINGGTFSNKTIAKQGGDNETRVVIFNNGMAEGFNVTDTGALVIRATGSTGKVEAVYSQPTTDNDFASEFLGLNIISRTDAENFAANLVYGDTKYPLEAGLISAADILGACTTLGTNTLDVEFTEAPYTAVYVSTLSGSDENDGRTADAPVKSLSTAYSKVKDNAGTIYIVDELYFGGSTYGASLNISNTEVTIAGDPDFDPEDHGGQAKPILRLKGSFLFEDANTHPDGRIKFENLDFAVATTNQWSFVNFCGVGYEFGEGIGTLTGTDPDGDTYKNLCFRAGGESGRNIYGAKQIIRSGSYNTAHLAGKGGATFGDIDFELYGGAVSVNCGNDSAKDSSNNPIYGTLTNVKVLLNAAPRSYSHNNISAITGTYQFIANNGVATVPNLPAALATENFVKNSYWAISSAEGGMASFTETAGTFAFDTECKYVVVDGEDYYEASESPIALTAGAHSVTYTDEEPAVHYNVTISIGELSESGKVEENTEITLPDATIVSAFGNIIGWYDGTDFLPLGASYTITKDVTFVGVALDVYQADGASVRMVDPTGLRFTSFVDAEEYDFLASISSDVKFGTVIAPLDYISGDFTMAALDAEGKAYLNIVNEAFAEENDVYKEFRSVISNIKTANYARSFAGRAYVSFTYSDGTEGIVYTNFAADVNARSVKDVAAAALADSSASYTDAQRTVLEGFAG